ncbi:MAG: hypothetical protein QM831_35495 [Kofleriaceae bacterium]
MAIPSVASGNYTAEARETGPTLAASGVTDPPRHGLVLVTHGEGGYRLVELVDLDVEELSMTEQNWGTQKSAATSFRPLSIESETADAMRARAAVVALTPFAAADGDQTLFVVDGIRIFADAPRTEGERELVALMRSVDHVQL